MKTKNKIFIGEICDKEEVYINGELADNVEKIMIYENINKLSFIVGKDLYKKGNIVIVALNGTVLKYSSVTKKYCKTRRGNPKGFHTIKSRNFNNITDEKGNSIKFESPGVIFNYYEVSDYIKHIYKINIPIKTEDVVGFLTSRKIDDSKYQFTESNILSNFIKKIKKLFTKN